MKQKTANVVQRVTLQSKQQHVLFLKDLLQVSGVSGLT